MTDRNSRLRGKLYRIFQGRLSQWLMHEGKFVIGRIKDKDMGIIGKRPACPSNQRYNIMTIETANLVAIPTTAIVLNPSFAPAPAAPAAAAPVPAPAPPVLAVSNLVAFPSSAMDIDWEKGIRQTEKSNIAMPTLAFRP